MATGKRLMCKIYFNRIEGELDEIVYSEDWKRASQLKKADILGDVVGQFQEDYDKYSAGFVAEIKKNLEDDERKGGERSQ